MFSDRFIYLISKAFSSTLDAAEESELHQLLADPHHAYEYEQLKKFWQFKENKQLPDVEKSLRNVLQQIEVEEEAVAPLPEIKSARKTRVWLGIAATVLVAALSFVLLRNRNLPAARTEGSVAVQPAQQLKEGWVEKQNAKGTRSVITLVDGSKVWLNADSRLQYPPSFEGNTREVSLSGEAFFEVAKNKARPFIIHLKNGTVKVLGTSFNIKAYDGEPFVETSVATGKVAFIPAKGKKGEVTFLTKNLKAVYSVETGLTQTVSTVSKIDKAWTEGKLIFNDTSMDEIAATLERYFGKQVIINDEVLHSYHLTGSFENNSAEEILYYLSKTKPFTYRITETEMILSAVQ